LSGWAEALRARRWSIGLGLLIGGLGLLFALQGAPLGEVMDGVRAVQRMVEYAPSTGALALWVGHADADDTDAEVAAAARLRWPERLRHPTPSPVTTDGRTLRYLPGFDALDLPTQTGWVAHGVLHIALRHVPRLQALRQRLGDVDAALYNLCADAIVNSALGHLRWLRPVAGRVPLRQPSRPEA
jgi:hypothetical protein